MSKKKKRGLPPVLKAWQQCRASNGVAPFKPMSAAKRTAVESCVRARMR